MIYLLLVVPLVASALAVVPKTPEVLLKDGRIVGGEDTTIEAYPHQVMLTLNDRHRCGGSIISERWVVSAAHCWDQYPSMENLFKILVGCTGYTCGTVHSIEAMIYHDLWNRNTTDYDIGVIKVEDPFIFGPRVQPIGLPDSNYYIEDGLYVVVTGWGATTQGGSTPDILQRVDVPIVSNERCNTMYAVFGGVTDQMLCAGYMEGGKDACQGDSGGPLIRDHVLLGVVSWGFGCAVPRFPGVYAHVPVLREWIRNETGI